MVNCEQTYGLSLIEMGGIAFAACFFPWRGSTHYSRAPSSNAASGSPSTFPAHLHVESSSNRDCTDDSGSKARSSAAQCSSPSTASSISWGERSARATSRLSKVFAFRRSRVKEIDKNHIPICLTCAIFRRKERIESDLKRYGFGDVPIFGLLE